ncbi:MAG: hypothetical protein ACKVT2_06810 [Saprospiraceae bacterium]
MKYPVLALMALIVFALASCKNKPGSTSPESALELKPTSISTVTPASEPNALSEQILTDFLEGQKESKKYAPANQENFELIKSMKMSWMSQGDAEKKQIEDLVKDAMMFFEVYQKHGEYVLQLDSLATNLMAGKIPVDHAQKEYLAIREQLQGVSGRLQTGEEKMRAVKSEWEREFPELSKK